MYFSNDFIGKDFQSTTHYFTILIAVEKEHRSHIEAERSRLTNTVDAIRQRQHLVKADFEIALQLATELGFLFEKGNYDEKQLLCETVFKRLYVEEGKITKTELMRPSL